MKNKNKQPFLGILFLSIIIGGMPHLHGQNAVFLHTFPGKMTENTIVRNYKSNIDIQYVIHYNGRPYTFEYIDRTGNVAYSFPLPYNFSIFDFEIYDGYVYFCGYGHPDSKVSLSAIYGWFNIDSAFFYNGSVHYITLASTLFPYPNLLPSTIDIFRKIAVEKVDGVVHLYMTGEGYCNNQPASVIADAWRDISGQNFHFTMDYSQDKYYRDVTVTQKNVVFVGIKDSGIYYDKHFILPYPCHTSSTVSQSIFDIISTSIWEAIPIIYLTPTSHIFSPDFYSPQIFSMDGDGFGTFCKDVITEQYVLSLYSNPVSNPYKRFLFPDGHNRIGNAVYNPWDKSICMAFDDGATHIMRTTSPYNDVIRVETLEPYHWNSVDWIKGTGNFIVSGDVLNWQAASMWVYNENHENCINNTSIDIFNVFLDQYSEALHQSYYRGIIELHSFPTDVVRTIVEKKCFE